MIEALKFNAISYGSAMKFLIFGLTITYCTVNVIVGWELYRNLLSMARWNDDATFMLLY